MKKYLIHALFFVFCIVHSLMHADTQAIKTVMFDMDDTTINRPEKAWINATVLGKNEYNKHKALYDNFAAWIRKGDYDGLLPKGTSIAPLAILYGIKHPEFQPLASNLIEKVDKSHGLIDGVQAILKRLDERGISVAFTTNKDHISYQNISNNLKLKTTALVHHPSDQKYHKAFIESCKSFVAQQPSKNPSIDANFLELTEKALGKKPGKGDHGDYTINHAPAPKPSPLYAEQQVALLPEGTRALFFDDKRDNLEVAETHSNNRITGIQADGTPMSIYKGLIKHGVLSKDNPQDRALLVTLLK